VRDDRRRFVINPQDEHNDDRDLGFFIGIGSDESNVMPSEVMDLTPVDGRSTHSLLATSTAQQKPPRVILALCYPT
jgi:hypothetical protein